MCRANQDKGRQEAPDKELDEEVQRTMNEPIGDLLQVDKQNGIIRIYFQNVNGFNLVPLGLIAQLWNTYRQWKLITQCFVNTSWTQPNPLLRTSCMILLGKDLDLETSSFRQPLAASGFKHPTNLEALCP
jgi:hypothetical protein